jgi:hypothetical protein
MFSMTPDGSVTSSNGRIMFFSVDRFVKDIAQGDCCFICGAKPGSKKFNDEHVLPDWILRISGLHNRRITLPNQIDFKYSRYKIPCCEDCNSLMGKQFEIPISELLSGGTDAVMKYIAEHGPWLFFVWLSLIFLKTHLKDKGFRFHLDQRQGDAKISDLYTWEEMHHIHCVAPSFYTGCNLDPKVMGSVIVVPAKTESFYEHFDFGDNSMSRTMLLRVGDTAFVTVLNDSCAAINLLQPTLERISGALSPIQLRELMSRLAISNLHLKVRPRFFSQFDLEKEKCLMSAELPTEWELDEWEKDTFGKLMYSCCATMLAALQHPENASAIENVKRGRWTFLFDENGKFIENSLKVVEDSTTQR